jgi:hypothetical protein
MVWAPGRRLGGGAGCQPPLRSGLGAVGGPLASHCEHDACTRARCPPQHSAGAAPPHCTAAPDARRGRRAPQEQIRQLLTGLMLSTPQLVRAQLSEALAIISGHDFPARCARGRGGREGSRPHHQPVTCSCGTSAPAGTAWLGPAPPIRWRAGRLPVLPAAGLAPGGRGAWRRADRFLPVARLRHAGAGGRRCCQSWWRASRRTTWASSTASPQRPTAFLSATGERRSRLPRCSAGALPRVRGARRRASRAVRWPSVGAQCLEVDSRPLELRARCAALCAHCVSRPVVIGPPLCPTAPLSRAAPRRNQYGSNELVAELAASQDVFAPPALEALQHISKTVGFGGRRRRLLAGSRPAARGWRRVGPPRGRSPHPLRAHCHMLL